jgi:adenine-specific DNA-methyltransferase
MNNETQHSDNSENPLIQVQTTDWNKERLEQLKNLMPDLFTNDGQLNINELKKVVDPNLVTETERYEFRWFGKSNAKREAFTPTDATLVYDENRSVNPTESENIIIEGENLAVLKLLSNSYREQVKCIYIDPPYNTGNDFVYSDKFNQDKKEYWEDAEVTENGLKIDTNSETDGRFHSNWLNMMYSRLLIARQLLKEDGVIFISIDDNEVHHLRKLCDEVFGEENFVGELIWKCRAGGGSDSKYFSSDHEYVICYSKNEEILERFYTDYTDEQLKKFEYEDKNGRYFLKTIEMPEALGKRPNLQYPISTPDGSIIEKKREGVNYTWVISQSEYEKYKENDLIEFKKSNEKWMVYRKYYLNSPDGELRQTKPRSIVDKVALTSAGSKELKSIFGIDDSIKIFDNPKPSKLLKHFYKIVTNENDLILDFFAGSGTTGQAVKELNQEDGGNRKYILVQLPEATESASEAYKAGYKKISDITIERNKRVVEKIIKEKKEAQPDLFSKKEDEQNPLKGLGFKVFKLQKSNFPRVEYAPDPNKTHEENIEALKKYIRDKEAQLISAFNKEELITEILLKNGFKLNYTLTKQEQFTKNEILFATDGDKETLVCLDGDLAEETVEHFKKHTEQKLIVLERALDTTKKWNLKHYMKDNFKAF